MKRIVTVQDLIDELMLVRNKDAEINIVSSNEDFATVFTPDLFDFSVIDYTEMDSDDVKNEVVIKLYR